MTVVSLNLNCRGTSEHERRSYTDKTYDVLHLYYLQPPIEFWHEVRRTGEGHCASTDEAPVQGRVLADSLTERTALMEKSEVERVHA